MIKGNNQQAILLDRFNLPDSEARLTKFIFLKQNKSGILRTNSMCLFIKIQIHTSNLIYQTPPRCIQLFHKIKKTKSIFPKPPIFLLKITRLG